ncbi:MAG TPA: hypothetical protein VK745_29875 [Polyangiaceae bacterium]|jgi:hypothetical protein|nr:hypothetical protein [Polyangiaceae bacterium]
MRASIKAWALLAAGSVLCCFGVALAQSNTPDAAIEINSQHDANLSLPQMLQRAREYKPMMDNDAISVQRQASEAKQQHDVVKSLCLSDKLSQIHVAVSTASGRIDTLSAAVSHNDSDRAKHEFTVIQVLKDRSSALVAEANQCIGEETGFIGDSTVTVTIDPSIPNTDPSDFPNNPIVSEPPVLSSPTM